MEKGILAAAIGKNSLEVIFMKEQRKLLGYYKQRMYHGRSALARAFDFFTLRLVFLLSCYLWFLSLVHNQLLAGMLSAIAVLMFSVVMSLINSIRLDRFIEKERARLNDENLREQLALMPREEFMGLAWRAAEKRSDIETVDGALRLHGEPCILYPVQQFSPLSADDMLSIYRVARRQKAVHVLLYTAVPAGAEAESFCRRLSEIQIHIESPEALLVLCREGVTPDTADELVKKKLEDAAAEKKRKRAQPFAAGQARKYLISALVLLLTSFLTRYALYYRLLAGVCLCLAGMSFWMNNNSKQKELKA